MWLDALVNYLTSIGYPESEENAPSEFVHVVGKDISKFHCIYWPAFLLAGGYPLPRKVINHGHWLQNKMKMSKSLGNVVDPNVILDKIGSNSVRSYFLSEGPLNKDANFEPSGLIDHHNKIIVGMYANILFRTTTPVILQYF